jgi:3-deoxy-D-manno-octulosonic-acid transferase
MPLFLYIFFYNCFIKFYAFAAYLLSIKNDKAKLFVNGRKNIFEKIKLQIQSNTNKKNIWIHCASLGEFEQAKPIIESLYKKEKYYIALSFFSPSGYEVSKNYPFAHAKFYLPLDTKQNAKKLLAIVNPSLIIFIKYEFWFHYLTQAKEQQIPIVLASGIFRESQPFFKWYSKLHLIMLNCFNEILVQNDTSKNLLNSIGFTNIKVTGDTRFDRVVQIADEDYKNEIIENFIKQNPCLIAGSTWYEDEVELQHFVNKQNNIVTIIAPHNVDDESIATCKKIFPSAVLYSSIQKNKNHSSNSNILIIDSIGILSKIYRYATICFIGGGFGNDGVHNVLEASVYGKALVFGPEYEKFAEAIDLVEINAAKSVENGLELEAVLFELFNNSQLQNQMGKLAYSNTIKNAGATKKSLTIVEKFL